MKSVYLASKQRYEILDGLRGVASIIVVAFHLFETYSKGPAYQILNHGYLAVDFFFVLSGFIIFHATVGKGKSAAQYAQSRFRRVYLPYLPVGIGIA